MELKKNNKLLTHNSSSTGITSNANRNHKMSNKVSTPLILHLSIAIFVLACALLVNVASAASASKQNSNNFVSPLLVGFGALSVEESEEFKRMAWNNWMLRLEAEWKELQESIEELKEKCLEEKESEFSDWLSSLQNKWYHYNKAMLKEYKCNVMENSSNWNDAQWENWVKNEGLKIIEEQWKTWIKKQDEQIRDLTLHKWIQWKNDKIRSWLLCEWKSEEDFYWTNWERSSTAKWLQEAEKAHWMKWKERINRESEQWENWVQMKESIYINEKWAKWAQWKNNKKHLFNKWSASLIYKWTLKKQWKVWIKEANNTTTMNDI
ncbi:tryptophan-rich antigen [Plasmodium gonderi]|uniref:Tryptophan-rich antigen n=1 Tax=Plasmodium gonderi TaxID=77519 RepID=A0A1Y1JAP4_PLAGO|nr:tryptophan-rich antigen [Plasmodium gonderi]GAW79601.1 tryptophan-rich antigen [Plasmodium gonderi]